MSELYANKETIIFNSIAGKKIPHNIIIKLFTKYRFSNSFIFIFASYLKDKTPDWFLPFSTMRFFYATEKS